MDALSRSPDLIVDIGAHCGDDSDFYLRKGFRVVAIEANPKHVEKLQSRFAEQIREGRMTVVGKGVHREYGRLEFYAHEHDDWSTFQQSDRFLPQNHEVLMVETIPFANILDRFGVPYYLKIDIEGLELEVVDSMIARGARPNYISVEVERNTPVILQKLHEIGYDAFKVVDQKAKDGWETVDPPREGNLVPFAFTNLMSGAFGDEIPGAWISAEEASEYLQRLLSGIDVHGSWFDLHAKLDPRDPSPAPFEEVKN